MRWLLIACAASFAGDVRGSEIMMPALGDEIEEVCTDEGLWTSLACAAYLRGLLEGLLAGETTATGGSVSFCLPSGRFDPDLIRSAFLASLNETPERRSLDAGIVMLDALEDHFPCEGPDDQDEPPRPENPAAAFVESAGRP